MHKLGYLTVLSVFSLSLVQLLHGQENTPPRRNPGFPATTPGKSSPGKTAEQLVKVRSLVDSQDVRPGDTFHLVFIFDIDPDWHIYWENAGASGAPTSVQVQGPPNYIIGKPKFPRPSIFTDPEGQTYGYHNQAAIFVEVKAPADVLAGKAHFTAKLQWLVCKEVCLMGRGQQAIDVAINPKALPGTPPRQKPTPSDDPVVQRFKKRLPQNLDEIDGAESRYDNSVLTVRIPAKSASEAVFFPRESPGVTYGPTSVKRDGDVLELTVPVTIDPNNSLGEEMKIAGVVGLGDAESLDESCYQFEIPLPGS